MTLEEHINKRVLRNDKSFTGMAEMAKVNQSSVLDLVYTILLLRYDYLYDESDEAPDDESDDGSDDESDGGSEDESSDESETEEPGDRSFFQILSYVLTAEDNYDNPQCIDA